jgi:hypothetical protein
MVSSDSSALILLPFLSVALHESGTRNALSFSLPNNTEVYLTPIISTQNHTIAVKNIVAFQLFFGEYCFLLSCVFLVSIYNVYLFFLDNSEEWLLLKTSSEQLFSHIMAITS